MKVSNLDWLALLVYWYVILHTLNRDVNVACQRVSIHTRFEVKNYLGIFYILTPSEAL